jgi:hypothetical protein
MFIDQKKSHQSVVFFLLIIALSILLTSCSGDQSSPENVAKAFIKALHGTVKRLENY